MWFIFICDYSQKGATRSDQERNMSVSEKQEDMFLLNLSTPTSTNGFQPHPITHPRFVDKPLRKNSDITGKKWFWVE